MGGPTQTQGKIEHEYDHLVKVVKQTEGGGQNKRDERISLEQHHKYRTSEKQEKNITLQYHVQEYLTPIKHEPNSFQNRPNKAILQGELLGKHKCTFRFIINAITFNDYIQCVHALVSGYIGTICGCVCLLLVMTVIGKSDKPL